MTEKVFKLDPYSPRGGKNDYVVTVFSENFEQNFVLTDKLHRDIIAAPDKFNVIAEMYI